jgi:hypothetical protein
MQPLPVLEPLSKVQQLLGIDLLVTQWVDAVVVTVITVPLEKLLFELDQSRIDLDPASCIRGLRRWRVGRLMSIELRCPISVKSAVLADMSLLRVSPAIDECYTYALRLPLT